MSDNPPILARKHYKQSSVFFGNYLGATDMARKSHWEGIYTTKTPTGVSWYQPHAAKSLELIKRTGVNASAQIIDVGGGASTLVDDLLAKGFRNLTVLDISPTALEAAQQRLGARAAQEVKWIEADITQAVLPRHHFDVWHDRAVFHFLTEADDRRRYVNGASDALKPGGHIIMATFAADGARQCSGLNVIRYSPEKLHAELGGAFEIIESLEETHLTPFDTTQKFTYCLCRKR